MANMPKIRFAGFTDAWEQRKFGEFVDFYNGDRSSRYPNDKDMVPEGIPFVNAGDLVNGRVKLDTANKITEDKYNELSGAKIQLGDIIYCLRGTLGKNAFVDNFEVGTVASSLVDIRPKNINGRYLFQVLNSDIEYRQRVAHDEGAAQPNLSAKNLSEFSIPVPNEVEQSKIADFLWNLDNTITLHQRKCDETKRLKKYMLQKMFPKNGESVPEIRFAGFTDPWEQRKLGDVTQRVRGNDGRMDLPTLTISAGSGWLDQRDRFSGNIAGKEQKNYTLLKKGQLSYNHGNSKLAKYGTVFELQDYKEALVPRVYHSFEVTDEATADFIEYTFATHKPERELRKLISSGARMDGLLNINYEEFMSIQMQFPSVEEQKQISRFLRHMDETITLHQRKRDELKEMKKFMLRNMFPEEG